MNRAGPKAEAFKPSDILDMHDDDSEDEILRKFKKRNSPSRSPQKYKGTKQLSKGESTHSLGRNYVNT